jgi:hypothetical protein
MQGKGKALNEDANKSRGSLGDWLREETRTWVATIAVAVLAVFSGKITEYVKVALNSADFREKNYEELAANLSEFNFDAELLVEYLDNNWTTAASLTPLINEYNDGVTKMRKNEYVYLWWLRRYWGTSKIQEFSKTYEAIKAIDAEFHSLNDELEAVNIKKGKEKVDERRAKQAIASLRPALKKLQDSSKMLLEGLQ